MQPRMRIGDVMPNLLCSIRHSSKVLQKRFRLLYHKELWLLATTQMSYSIIASISYIMLSPTVVIASKLTAILTQMKVVLKSQKYLSIGG